MSESIHLLINLFVYLLAAVIAVPGARKLGVGAIPGYLFAGIVIGPWGLAFIRDAGHIAHFTEFSVVMLLFLIGLSLKPATLKTMQRNMLVLGGSQLLATGFLIYLIAWAFAHDWRESIVVAIALSLSSSCLAQQILKEKGWTETAGGHSSRAILYGQDLMVIPMLVIVPLLGLAQPQSGISGWTGVLTAVFAVGVVLLLGRYVLTHAYRFIASLHMTEVFTAFLLLLLISMALLMESVGLSMALGAFLCGLLFADAEYRHEIENTIAPFKGLLLGLFFIAVGMSVDVGLILRRPSEILGLLLVLLLVKALVVFLIACAINLPLRERLWKSLLLSQSGEFAFVILGVATQYQTLTDHFAGTLAVVVTLSMLTTPLLLMALAWFERGMGVATPKAEEPIAVQPDVIIAGFGRMGQIVSRVLTASDVTFTVIDHDPTHIAQVQQFGFTAHYGDALRLNLLETAGAGNARVLVVSIDDPERALLLIDRVSERWPQLKIVARAWDMPHQWMLMDRGIEHVHRETFDSAVLMSEDVLMLLGRDLDEIERESEAFRDHDLRLLQQQYEAYSSDGLRQVSMRSRDEFIRLMEGDRQQQAFEQQIAEEEENGSIR